MISAGVLHRLPSERATEPFALLRVLPRRRLAGHSQLNERLSVSLIVTAGHDSSGCDTLNECSEQPLTAADTQVPILTIIFVINSINLVY